MRLQFISPLIHKSNGFCFSHKLQRFHNYRNNPVQNLNLDFCCLFRSTSFQVGYFGHIPNKGETEMQWRIWGGARLSPPRPKISSFSCNWSNDRLAPPRGWYPLWEILDPPLKCQLWLDVRSPCPDQPGGYAWNGAKWAGETYAPGHMKSDTPAFGNPP